MLVYTTQDVLLVLPDEEFCFVRPERYVSSTHAVWGGSDRRGLIFLKSVSLVKKRGTAARVLPTRDLRLYKCPTTGKN